MDRERYERVAAVFHQAVDLEGDERRAFLDRACAGDDPLRRDVEHLLEQDGEAEGGAGSDRIHRAEAVIAEALAGCAASSQARWPGPGWLPERIGHYRILREIGKGGMGAVFLAQQDDPQRLVALKILRPDLLSPGLRRRFEFEVEVLGRLRHPGIAQILEAGKIETERGELPFFAMEHVDGVELRRYACQRELNDRGRLELIARVCDAVHHAHLKGIVHRDLKPDNVLVVEEASTTPPDGVREFAHLGQPKVLDFGIARATDSDVQVTTMHTDAPRLVGTLTYMSPEQLAGDSRLLDARSDIYALGVMLFELLTGRLPFDLRGRALAEAVRVVREEDPVHPGSIRAELRGDIDTIVSKCLRKECEQRYSSAAEMAADLRRYLAGEPIFAHSPSTFYRLNKFVRRHKGLVAGLVLSFAILLGGLVSSMTLAVRATRSEHRSMRSAAAAQRAGYRLGLIAADAIGRVEPLRALAHLEALSPELRGWEWRHLRARFTPHAREFLVEEPDVSTRMPAFSSHLRVTACRPDGSLVIVRTGAAGVELVDPSDGDVLGLLGPSEGGAILPTLSPDGSRVATISRSRDELAVWDSRSGERLFATGVSATDLGGVCFSPDGSLLVLSSTEDARVLDAATGDLKFRTGSYPSNAGQVVFARDGARFAVHGFSWGGRSAAPGDFFIGLYSTTGEVLGHRELHDGNGAMAFSPDGRQLAIGQVQRMIRILDGATLEDAALLHGHSKMVTALAYSDDGARLASGSCDGTVRIWDIPTGTVERVLPSVPTEFGITSLTFGGEGNQLAAGNYLGIRFWMLEQTAFRVLQAHARFAYVLAFHPDGTLLASTGWDDTVNLWDPRTGERLASFSAPDGQFKLSFTPDGTRLIGCRLWDPAAGVRLTRPRNEGDERLLEAVRYEWNAKKRRYNPFIRFASGGTKLIDGAGERVALARDRSLIADGLETGEIRIDDPVTDSIVKQIGGPGPPVRAVSFSPDTKRVVAGDQEGFIKVLDRASGAEIARWKGHASEVYSVIFSPCGSRIVSAGNDDNVVVWDAVTFEEIMVLRCETGYVHSVCFSPDGTMLAAACGNGTVRIWDSLPPAMRWRETLRAERLRREAEPWVDKWFETLADPSEVADRLRADESLPEELRSAALRVLLERRHAASGHDPR
jgi:serine/threonine protein kinase/WD40 repeat protein